MSKQITLNYSLGLLPINETEIEHSDQPLVDTPSNMGGLFASYHPFDQNYIPNLNAPITASTTLPLMDSPYDSLSIIPASPTSCLVADWQKEDQNNFNYEMMKFLQNTDDTNASESEFPMESILRPESQGPFNFEQENNIPSCTTKTFLPVNVAPNTNNILAGPQMNNNSSVHSLHFNKETKIGTFRYSKNNIVCTLELTYFSKIICSDLSTKLRSKLEKEKKVQKGTSLADHSLKILNSGLNYGEDLNEIKPGKDTVITVAGNSLEGKTGILYLCSKNGKIAIYDEFKAQSFSININVKKWLFDALYQCDIGKKAKFWLSAEFNEVVMETRVFTFGYKSKKISEETQLPPILQVCGFVGTSSSDPSESKPVKTTTVKDVSEEQQKFEADLSNLIKTHFGEESANVAAETGIITKMFKQLEKRAKRAPVSKKRGGSHIIDVVTVEESGKKMQRKRSVKN